MAAPEYEFQGWLGHSPAAAEGRMEWGKYEPKQWTEDDVDIQVTHCGVCGSDLHMLRSGWFDTPYPCCVGHEIVGRAVRVGSRVAGDIRVGDRVGVGAQARSCLEKSCAACSSGRENYCARANISTYGAVYPGGEGKSYGGYADYNRTHGRFVFKIPAGLPSEFAAPMLCAGITVFSPLRRERCGPGKSVGIVGVGGLGHFGVLFAKALGADRVVGISRKAEKRDDVLRLGADEYIATDDGGGGSWAEDHARSLDLIVCTVSSEDMPLTDYLRLLKVDGVFIQVGNPDGGKLPRVSALTLLEGGVKMGGSSIGSPDEIREMLQFAADKGIKPWVEMRSLQDANQTVVDMAQGKARYRYVLVNDRHAAAGIVN
ncbi:zinc-binding dehydrogenase [Lasiosphaeria ovina]|uniref:alcohol dehydrogenase (NADP(+)) n=1 Tax=Lasiosphaeria ovina TaxID=92902 RepID=A0AAE0JZM2_9PEZI|nr:zinc-binding dehydrogenase [Lasiosphaeria ovina]